MKRESPPPLVVNPELVGTLRAIQEMAFDGEEARRKLGTLLQSALQLEFATVPPYLSAAFSIRSGNEEIRNLIARVAKEEMLHMTVLANVMNAIGVAPDIVAAVPDYPYDLDVLDPALHLNLESFSFKLVEELFMQIETPEEPVDFPSHVIPEAGLPQTIGQFYQDIIEIIASDTIPDLFRNAERDAYKQIEVDPNLQSIRYVNNQDSHTYPLQDDFNFVVTGKETALRHLEWIIAEGEGASKFNPIGPEGIPGHYYRFESILESRYLVEDHRVDEGFSYSGGSLPFTPEGIHGFAPNAKVEDYAVHPRVERHMKRFNERYTRMIDLLQTAFNCPSPDQEQHAKAAYSESIGLMRNMPNQATAILDAAQASGIKAGIPFQYVPGG